MTIPRYGHSISLNEEQEARLQDVLRHTNFSFSKLVTWAMEKAEDELNTKKESK